MSTTTTTQEPVTVEGQTFTGNAAKVAARALAHLRTAEAMDRTGNAYDAQVHREDAKRALATAREMQRIAGGAR